MNKFSFALVLFIALFSCSQEVTYNDPIPNHDKFTIASKAVDESRVINVWTPPNYKNGTDSLPVLYMPDGGVKEDFPHIANTVAKLVEIKSIPPIILVGIENTERRRDLSGFSEVKEDSIYCPLTDGAKNFRAFIAGELVPEINSKYRTTSKKGILGESLAGLFVMETFLLEPNLFDFYVAMDPSLWWNDHHLVKKADEFLNAFPEKEIKLWFAGSDAEDISEHTKELAKILKNNPSNNLVFKYSDEPNEKHNTIFRATKENALTWILDEKEE